MPTCLARIVPLLLLGVLPLASGCADPGVPLIDAVPTEFKAWAAKQGDSESWVTSGHRPFAVHLSSDDEERRLHGPHVLAQVGRRLAPGRGEIALALRGWQPGVSIVAVHYRIFALPEDYAHKDWPKLQAEPPTAAGTLNPDAAGNFAAKVLVSCGPEGPQEFLVSTLVESDAGLLYPGPHVAEIGPLAAPAEEGK